jgi:autotransporter-associated beta strand protein
VASSQAFAVNHTTSVQQAGGTNWNDPAIWTPNDGLAPHAGDTYEVILGATNPARLRNPINGSDVVFGGDSLKLNVSTEIRFKAKAANAATTITFNNGGLILNGGLLNTGDDVQFTLAGLISVTADSIIDTIDANNPNAPDDQRSYLIQSSIAGTANLSLKLGRTLSPAFTIAGNNSTYTGDWNINAGWFVVTAMNALGSGDVTLTTTTTASGTFTSFFESDVDFVSPGTLTLIGSSTVLRLDEQITFGAVAINGTSLAPGTYTTDQLEAMFPSNIADVGFGSTVDGTLTVVPEPSSAALCLLSGLCVAARRRRPAS